jgi:glycosyltransferase involved in cell wall biosynthesis
MTAGSRTASGPRAREAVGPPWSSVAIVHDYLNQPGGAERVVLEMASMWPDAPIYTSLYRPKSTFPEFQARDIRTSFLDRLPVDARFRTLLPLYPAAFHSFGVLDYDLVVSSSSGWAHGVRTAPESVHIVYCYAPARWLYTQEAYLPSSVKQRIVAPLVEPLRRWDLRAAHRTDGYIVIAENVRRRVRAAYGIETEVVYPPVNTERFRVTPRGERLLAVARLLPYKRIDLVVRAATRLGMGLDVVGVGPSLEELRALAGPTVTFHGRLPDEAITELFESCFALCSPGQEDFGITPIEALAAGKPVVAYAAGGALETLEDGRTAAFFREPTVEQVVEAIHRVARLDTPPEDLAAAARRFSRVAFHPNLEAAIERLASRRFVGVAA